MKNWNGAAWFKSIFTAIFAVFAFFAPDLHEERDLVFVITQTVGSGIGMILMGLFVVFMGKYLLKSKISLPDWNDNIIPFGPILSMLQFLKVGWIVIGVSNVLGLLILRSSISLFGFQLICAGIGMFLAIRISQRAFLDTDVEQEL